MRKYRPKNTTAFQELHQKLVEAAAENDETLMEKFFDQGHLTEDEMREGIRKGLVDRSIFPVFCVSALKDMGVRRMMEFLGNVVPFVEDMPAPVDTEGEEVKPDSDGPLSLFMFKTTIEPHIGEVSYFKVMSGTLTPGVDLSNVDRGSKERIAQVFCVCGQIKTPVDKLCAGDIGATVKLKDARTGNTLDEKGCEYRFDFIKYPAPKYQRAVRPVTEADAEKLSEILTRMHEEDPTWEVQRVKRAQADHTRARVNSTCAHSNGASKTTTSSPSYSKSRAYRIARLSRRPHVPTTVTRNSRVAPDSSARFT